MSLSVISPNLWSRYTTAGVLIGSNGLTITSHFASARGPNAMYLLYRDSNSRVVLRAYYTDGTTVNNSSIATNLTVNAFNPPTGAAFIGNICYFPQGNSTPAGSLARTIMGFNVITNSAATLLTLTNSNLGTGDLLGFERSSTTIYRCQKRDGLQPPAFVRAWTTAGVRDASKDLLLHADNQNPIDCALDGNTMYVLDSTDDQVYSYTV